MELIFKNPRRYAERYGEECPISRARDIYDEIGTNSETLERWITEAKQEDVNLEFKRKANAATADVDSSDQKNFAKALSGFSNSSGGVLVWGIDARKNTDGIDAAAAKHPLTKPEAFQSKLQSLVGEYCHPKNDGVMIKFVGDRANGYVVVLIPESPRKPHRSNESATRGQYFKRAGDSFYLMEHFDLEDMFGRRPSPHLAVCIQLERYSTDNFNETFSLKFGLVNQGQYLAKYPFMSVALQRPHEVDYYHLDGNGNPGLPAFKQGTRPGMSYFRGTDGQVIHSLQSLWVSRIKLTRSKNPPNLMVNDPLKVRFEAACEEMPVKFCDLVFDGDYIKKSIITDFREEIYPVYSIFD